VGSLIERIETTNDLEIIVVGPECRLAKALRDRALAKCSYLGFKTTGRSCQGAGQCDAAAISDELRERA